MAVTRVERRLRLRDHRGRLRAATVFAHRGRDAAASTHRTGWRYRSLSRSCRARRSSRSSSLIPLGVLVVTSFSHWSVFGFHFNGLANYWPADPRLDLLDGVHQHRALRGGRHLHPGPDRRRRRDDPRAADPRLGTLPRDPLLPGRHLRRGLRADLRQRLQRELRPAQLGCWTCRHREAATGSSTSARRSRPSPAPMPSTSASS